VTPRDLKQLVNATKKLLNKLNAALNRIEHAFNLSSHEEIVRLLDDLGKAP
jgi:hypothetical protein